MESKIQWVGTRMRRVLTIGQAALGFGINPQGMFVPVVAMLILIGLAFPVCGQVSSEWEILGVREKEYVAEDTPKDIPGRGTETSVLTITDTGPITDVNVKVNITHPFDADMDIYLIAPDDTRVELFTDVGGLGQDFIDTILDNEASQSITEGSAPFTGTYRPEGDLAELYGKEMEGQWTLEVTDDSGASRAGTLNAWSLIVKFGVAEPLSPPVVQTEEGAPDTISWKDIGETRQYDSDVPEAIPDLGTLTSELVIEDVGKIQDVNVRVNISHSLDSDLDVFLIAPDGTGIELFTDVGGSGDNFEDTILDDEAEVSITDGSAPFAGSYRPEGLLFDLIDLDICGTWTLKVTDDSMFSSGTLNSWSLIADLADVAYYAECASDVDFGNVVANSGWMTDTSHTFTELAQAKEYWYRAKARPLEAWLQTTEEHFEKDALTDTQSVNGDITLSGGGGGPGEEVHIIDEPSFNSLGPWSGGRTNSNIIVGRIREMWASDGEWAGFVGFSYDALYIKDDFGFLAQPVDWTGVDTLVFDYASWGFGDQLEAAVFVGNTLVWVKDGTDASIYPPDFISAEYNETIDVSAFDGVQDLGLVVYAATTGRFDAAILWDNLRTYGPSGYEPSGEIISTPITIGEADTWNVLAFNATTPKGTELTLDILPAVGSEPIDPWRQIPSSDNTLKLVDLRSLNEKTIRLRANLSTTDPSETPVLHDWSITYTDAARESQWSNVVSSLPKNN